MTTPMTRKLGKVCPPPGMLPPPCAGEKLTSADKTEIMAEFAGVIPRAKLEAALDMVKSNHAEAARRANWVLSSVRDSEFLGARPQRKKKRKTRKKGHKRGGAPEWVENRVTTLIIMLAIGGGFWALWPMLEGTLITYGLLPELCGAGFSEHVGVMFGSMATHGAVLTCLARERQYRAVIGGLLTALTGTGIVTRERVTENYAEVHAYVRNAVFGPGGLLGPPLPLTAVTPPQTPPSSASWGSVGSQPGSSPGSVASANSGSMSPAAQPMAPQAVPPLLVPPANMQPLAPVAAASPAVSPAVSPQLSPAASASPQAAPASGSASPQAAAQPPPASGSASPQGSQGGRRGTRRRKSKRGGRSRKRARSRKTHRRLRRRKHRTGRH